MDNWSLFFFKCTMFTLLPYSTLRIRVVMTGFPPEPNNNLYINFISSSSCIITLLSVANISTNMSFIVHISNFCQVAWKSWQFITKFKHYKFTIQVLQSLLFSNCNSTGGGGGGQDIHETHILVKSLK